MKRDTKIAIFCSLVFICLLHLISVLWHDINSKQECHHHYFITEETKSTCTSKGSITYTCNDCGEELTVETPKHDHDLIIVEHVEADDIHGEVDVYRCINCDGDFYR